MRTINRSETAINSCNQSSSITSSTGKRKTRLRPRQGGRSFCIDYKPRILVLASAVHRGVLKCGYGWFNLIQCSPVQHHPLSLSLFPHKSDPQLPVTSLWPLLNPRGGARWRFFTSGALTSGERTVGLDGAGEKGQVAGSRSVPEFRRKLKVAEVKGGAEEGLDRVGQTLVVKGWVRTLRSQSSVTFIEVNDGSCLSNMQCVLDSKADRYDQVESGFVTTGASVWVEGTVVKSQGSKQKVELKVHKIIAGG